MSDYLLDTNHASPLVTLEHPLRELILQRVDEGDSFAICTPVLTETLYGIGILPRAAQNLREWERLRLFLPCFAADETDAKFAAELQILLRLQGRQLNTVDALVAAVALRYDLIVLTKDKDFRVVPNLRYENWLKV
ncbi:MAG: type II toxin-antitoxin system VapC family toxin [Caldilineaceae bacterium]